MSRTERKQLRVVSPRVDLRRRFADIWRYRELLVGLVRKELKVKYKDSVLGFVWSMLNPALYLTVFYILFTYVLPNGIPYFAVFLLSGLLVWNLFSTALPSATGAVVGNSTIVKKVAFPREILALASVGAALVHFFLQCIVLLVALAVFRQPPAPSYLPLLVPALLALLLFAAATGVFLSAVNVYLRDTQHLLELVLLAWFWGTPIVYPYRQVADRLGHMAWVYRLNPVTPIVLTFQRAIYNKLEPVGKGGGIVKILPPFAGQWWYLSQLLVVIGASAVLLCLALKFFGRVEGNFAEEL
jgi:ABC-2 type transport system permease protein